MSKVVELTNADARRLLARHHFEPTTAEGVFERFGSVQYDPLNPVGRNHDLVLQARVPDYKVDDWQKLAYSDRFLLDAWDKQASLVRMRDWAVRRIYHWWHAPRWREKILKPYPKAVAAVLAELESRGPLTSTAFDFQLHNDDWAGSWYGPKLTKNILRALWHTGTVVTHSRKNGHHVYDLAERVVPAEYLNALRVSEQASAEWLINLRHQAVGLLRPNASSEVWSLYIPARERHNIIASMIAKGELVAVDVDGLRFHTPPAVLAKLEQPPLAPQMMFVAPLDQLVWDRKALQHLFGFDYLWEVYKPEAQRKWGYYVLPVFYKDAFVARFDSRLKDGVWQLYNWYWENDTTPDAEQLSALADAVQRFKRYLGADKLALPRTGLDQATRAAWKAGGK